MANIKPDSRETLDLLGRIGAGEQEAFNRLFARHRAWLERLVELRMDGRLRSRLDAADVVQDTQLEAFRRFTSYLERRPMPFRLWLRKTLEDRLRMAERRHLGAMRRSVRRELTIPDTGDSSEGARPSGQLPGIDPTPSALFARDELAVRVRRAINLLDENDREILLMRSLENLSYGEVSYILDIDEATARKRHGRALLKLHAQLAREGFTESQF